MEQIKYTVVCYCELIHFRVKFSLSWKLLCPTPILILVVYPLPQSLSPWGNYLYTMQTSFLATYGPDVVIAPMSQSWIRRTGHASASYFSICLLIKHKVNHSILIMPHGCTLSFQAIIDQSFPTSVILFLTENIFLVSRHN